MSSVFEARGVTKRFGGLVAVNAVDLDVGEEEIVGLIGPNGAGKTTFFNCLTGMEVPTSGEIRYRGRRLRGSPNRITAAGLARTFQNIRLFSNMSVLENVLVGRHCRTREGLFSAILRGRNFKREERESKARSLELLELVGLRRAADDLARNLNYGDQRRLEIARALATEPGLLLLDEPTAGMNAAETRSTGDLVRRIRDQGKAIVVIEHDMRFIFGLCDRVAVLVQGQKLTEGTPAEVQSDPRVIAAYLGTPADSGGSRRRDQGGTPCPPGSGGSRRRDQGGTPCPPGSGGSPRRDQGGTPCPPGSGGSRRRGQGDTPCPPG